ncbi:MAG: Clp protease [Xanthobacteraceae bacterium]|jgi:ATP-dependent protease ClpP protease subunit|nr:Clp protease [Xanthobacteraceae bacterium]
MHNLEWADPPDVIAARRAEAEAAGWTGPVSIDIIGDIDTTMAERVGALLDAAPRAEHVVITIDSPGGRFPAALDIHALLAGHPAKRKVARIRRAESAAILVAMAADWRVAEPGAVILLHAAAMPASAARLTAAAHREAARHLGWLDGQTAKLMERRTGTAAKVFMDAMQDEAPSSIDWCLRYGVVNEVFHE